MFPFWTMPPAGLLAGHVVARAWVPMEDEHVLMFMAIPRPPDGARSSRRDGPAPIALLPNKTGWYGLRRPPRARPGAGRGFA